MADEERLSVFDPERCRCFMHCTNRAVVDGLCDECWLEYWAYRLVYRAPEEL